MADERLRALEREWKETGDDALGARYLLERARLGLLPERGLELAAWLGFAPARLALEGSGQAPPEAPSFNADAYDAVRRFVGALGTAFGPAPVLRVGLAAAEQIYPDYRTLFPEDARVRGAIDAVSDWLACPCAAHAAACGRRGASARTAEERALAQFQRWGIAFSHEASTFGREGEPGGDDLEELVHDAGEDDFDGFNLCHDRHFDVAFFQIPGLAACLAEAVPMDELACDHLAEGLQRATEESWESEYDSGWIFGEGAGEYPDDMPYGNGWVEVAPAPPLSQAQLLELAPRVLLGWVLGGEVAPETEPVEVAPPASDDGWESHLAAFPRALEGLEAWCAALLPFGQPLGARVAAAAARRCLARWEARWDPRPRVAVEAALGWAACPCAEHAAACESACDAAVDAMDEGPAVAEAAARAAEVALAGDDWPGVVFSVLDVATDEVSLRALGDALRASFEAWALGLEPGQPV